MDDLRYLNNPDKFLNDAFDVFKEYFANRKQFDDFFASIPSDEAKNRFLKMASLYKFLIKDRRLAHENQDYVDYIDETYEYIALVSLIEALCGREDYIQCYDGPEKGASPGAFPVVDSHTLQTLCEKYKRDPDSIHKMMIFFRSLDAAGQKFLQTKLKVSRQEETVEPLTKLLYQFKSEFLRHARLVLEFGDSTVLSARKKVVQTGLTLDDMSVFFERGLLTHFGYSGKF
ncbi:MAG: hypothetical protein HY204_12200 [Nitrospirae bacterium]|nr:hypothetical protein [Nitrospirota bacterium]